MRRVGGMGMLAQLFPVGLGHLDAEFPGSSFDSVEGLLALLVGDVLDLIEARDGVADVGGVFEGLFALVGKGEVGVVDFFAVFGGEVVRFGWHEVLRKRDVQRLASGRLVGLDGGRVVRVWLWLEGGWLGLRWVGAVGLRPRPTQRKERGGWGTRRN